MKNLQDATEMICDLKGSIMAFDALFTALVRQMPAQSREDLMRAFSSHAEVARTVLLHAPISDFTVDAFERDVSRLSSVIAGSPDGRALLETPPGPAAGSRGAAL